jgi:SSS family solute:Na+ symporter
MRNGLTTLDLLVFLFYLLGGLGYGYYIYRRKQKTELNSKGYFLAKGSLTWWAIGASMKSTPCPSFWSSATTPR